MRISSPNSGITLTEEQARVLLTAHLNKLDTRTGPALLKMSRSRLAHVAERLERLDLLLTHAIQISPRELRYVVTAAGEGWLDECWRSIPKKSEESSEP